MSTNIYVIECNETNWFRGSLPLSMSAVVDEISGIKKNEASCFDFPNQNHSPCTIYNFSFSDSNFYRRKILNVRVFEWSVGLYIYISMYRDFFILFFIFLFIVVCIYFYRTIFSIYLQIIPRSFQIVV